MADDDNIDPDVYVLNNISDCVSTYLNEDKLNSFFDFDNRSSLNLMHVNCRSLSKNFTSLNCLLANIDDTLTVLGLTETWLNPVSEDNFKIDGYKFMSNSRSGRNGGGVGLFIDDNYVFRLRKDLLIMKDFIECIFVEIVQMGTSNIIIGCVYRPPNTDLSLFNDEILKILSILGQNSKKLAFIMGDFNLDLLHSDSHLQTGEFLNNFLSYSFLPSIQHPTRITETSATLLDNIFTNNIRYKMKTGIVYSDISDHFPVIMHVHFNLKKNKPILCCRRFYNEDSIENFKYALGNENWNDISNNPDGSPTTSYNLFIDKFTNVFNIHFPVKSFKPSSKKHQEMLGFQRDL